MKSDFRRSQPRYSLQDYNYSFNMAYVSLYSEHSTDLSLYIEVYTVNPLIYSLKITASL